MTPEATGRAGTAPRAKIERYRDAWDELARRDPLWTIKSDPEQAATGWAPEAFFATGREEVDGVLARMAAVGITTPHRRALDFGCGVGRLTQALARTYDRVDGVDISPAMIDEANRYNRFGDRCVYHVNVATDLARFESGAFDLVYTRLVLQHIPPRFARAYMAEFVRLLSPAGVLFLQLPSGPENRALRVVPPAMLDWTFNHGRAIVRKIRGAGRSTWEMHWLPPERVARIFHAAGGEIVHAEPDDTIRGQLRAMRYFVRRTRGR